MEKDTKKDGYIVVDKSWVRKAAMSTPKEAIKIINEVARRKPVNRPEPTVSNFSGVRLLLIMGSMVILALLVVWMV